MKKEQIKRLLPALFQSALQPGSPLFAILDVMETLHAPSEVAMGSLAANFDPYLAPDAFVPYLASWVDLEVLLDPPRTESSSSIPSPSTGLGRLRELTAAAATLSQWRGTRKGLCMFLKTATGATGFKVDEQVRGDDGRIKPFHLRVTAPQELAEHRILIDRIIQLEKPAYVTYELAFSDSKAEGDESTCLE
jgi:phage tail-like protein